MTDKRVEFGRIRQGLQKDAAHGAFICSRCGSYGKSIHLHHIVELCEGGDNRIGNLIPLCGSCHREWDLYKGKTLSFEEFLITPSAPVWALLISLGVAGMKSNIGDLIIISYYARFESFANMYAKEYGVEPSAYYEEMKRQNSVFSAFPYSDIPTMLSLYGDFCDKGKGSIRNFRKNQKRLSEFFGLP